MDDLPDTGLPRQQEQFSGHLDGAFEGPGAVVEPDVVRVDEDVHATERIGHSGGSIEVIGVSAHTAVEPVVRRMRGQAPDLGAVDEAYGDGSPDIAGCAGDQHDVACHIRLERHEGTSCGGPGRARFECREPWGLSVCLC